MTLAMYSRLSSEMCIKDFACAEFLLLFAVKRKYGLSGVFKIGLAARLLANAIYDRCHPPPSRSEAFARRSDQVGRFRLRFPPFLCNAGLTPARHRADTRAG
jgi:hypothetical protein